MSYLDDMIKDMKRVSNKRTYVNVSKTGAEHHRVSKKEKPQLSEERALIRSILKEEHISDKELVEILLKEQRNRAAQKEEEKNQQEHLKRLEEEVCQQEALQRAEEEARQQELSKRQEEEALRRAELKRQEEEVRHQAELRRQEEEERLRREMKQLEEARIKREERRRREEEKKKAEQLKNANVEHELSILTLEEFHDNDIEVIQEIVPEKASEEALEKASEEVSEKVLEKSSENVEKDSEEIIDEKPAKKKSIGRELLEWLIYIAIIVGIMFLIITYVGVKTKVSGSSMETTLHNNDNLIVEKISYRFNDPERYDIVVFPYEYEEGVYYIKRIIGMPGETIQVKDGVVYLNGEVLESDVYGMEPMESAGIADTPIELGDDEYFVLGDNRNHSADSREQSVGVLQGDDFIGKAWVRIWPISQFGVLDHE